MTGPRPVIYREDFKLFFNLYLIYLTIYLANTFPYIFSSLWQGQAVGHVPGCLSCCASKNYDGGGRKDMQVQ